MVLLTVCCCGLVRALPPYTSTVSKVTTANLRMATDDILQHKPFEFENPNSYYWWHGLYCPEPFGLTDATSASGPVDDMFAMGQDRQMSYRWDLGSVGPQGRRLDSITVTWAMFDSARNSIHLQFYAHDASTRQWQALTSPIVVAAEGNGANGHLNDGYWKVLTITFEHAGAVTNFDALRMIDLNGAYTTRIVEVDACTYPNNR
jgi:hypothetical protein